MIKISVSIDVPDLERAEEFYASALGCEKLRNQGDDMVILSAGNAEIYLLRRSAGSDPIDGSGLSRSYERHWTPVHIDFLAENVEEVVAKVKELGGGYEGGESGAWGAIAYLVDPFGNGFCVINE